MMNLFNNWNPINTLENLLYVVVTFLMLNFFVVKPLRNDLKRLENHIVQIAMQPRYSISNDFEKMRTKKGGSIVLDFENEMNHIELMPMDTVVVDSVTAKRGLFKRIFKRKDK